MNMPTASSPGFGDPMRPRNGEGGDGDGAGNGDNGRHHDPDAGPPAILIEIEPAALIDVADADKLAAFVDGFQAAVAPLATELRSAGLVLAGPSVVAASNLHDNIPIVRLGLWLLSPNFPFAAQDPNHPHQLPVLTPASAALGFSQASLIGVAKPAGLGAGFALAIPMTTLNTLATAALPKLQQAASKHGASVNSVTITSSPPSPPGPAGGDVVTTVEGSFGVPPADISGTITETLGLQAGIAPGTMVPAVTGTFSSRTDAGNELLLGAAVILSGGILGIPFLIEALGITLGAPPLLGAEIGPLIAQVTALVNMLPPVLPFEPSRPIELLPDFPKLIFNWSAFVATTSEIAGRATVTVVGRPPGSGSLTLSGPTELSGIQADMAGGAAARYTVTWADIAPASVGWQVNGPTGDSAGSISTKVFPFNQGFVVDFPLPVPVNPGHYRFTLRAVATEANVKKPNETLTASAARDVTVNVRKNPVILP